MRYFCITTNISTADQTVHTQGVLWRAVRASMSILDYLPPVVLNNELLIDGGYVNNIPVDVMVRSCTNRSSMLALCSLH